MSSWPLKADDTCLFVSPSYVIYCYRSYPAGHCYVMYCPFICVNMFSGHKFDNVLQILNVNFFVNAVHCSCVVLVQTVAEFECKGQKVFAWSETVRGVAMILCTEAHTFFNICTRYHSTCVTNSLT